MKSLLPTLIRIADVAAAPFVYPAGLLLRLVRQAGVHRMPVSRGVLRQVGVFPIRDHYYEPQFTRSPAEPPRRLPGIDFDVPAQLALLQRMTRADELADLPRNLQGPGRFHLENGLFEAGDAEFWYQLIRLVKPRRIIEVGSGYSTLMAMRALARNAAEDPDTACRHTCIEPYEMPWLEQTGVEVLRRRIEDVPLDFFQQLGDGDILFIDSSHVIRPHGDVLCEFLEVIPTLAPGVIVHVHDIFSPRNYPRDWIEDRVRFWNEQYLLEAFLSNNADWRVLAALNQLHNEQPEAFRKVAPFVTEDTRPGSFYMVRRGGRT